MRRRVAVPILAALVLAAGCGTGATPAQYFDPQGPGATGRVGDVVVTDAQLGDDGPDTALTVQATIVNEGRTPDRLTSVSSPTGGAARIVGDPALPPGGALVTGSAQPAAAADLPGPTPVGLTLGTPADPVRAGLTYPVDFTFAAAGTVRLQVPVADPDTPRAADTG
jgi:copper(I)-binding protein